MVYSFKRLLGGKSLGGRHANLASGFAALGSFIFCVRVNRQHLACNLQLNGQVYTGDFYSNALIERTDIGGIETGLYLIVLAFLDGAFGLNRGSASAGRNG